MGVSYRERILEDRLDWSPDIDDLVASLEELVRFRGEMVRYSTPGSVVGLINVHAGNRTPQWLLAVTFVACSSADSVVENEDLRCASANNY